MMNHKRVGIIGTGSTAAQVVPGIVDKAETLTLFQRTVQWVASVPDKKYNESFKARRRKYKKCLELIAQGRVRSLDPRLGVALRLKEEMRQP